MILRPVRKNIVRKPEHQQPTTITKQHIQKMGIPTIINNMGYGAITAVSALLLCTAQAGATFPEGYYNSLNGKKGAELKQAVKAVAQKNHSAVSYGESGTWNAFKDTDVKTVNGVDYWWDMYSSNLVRVSGGHGGLNIEHSVANSWWGKTKNDAYKDLCHLNPSDSKANSSKGNYPLAEVDRSQKISYDNGVTLVGKAVAGQGGGATWVFEPLDEYKGDFARAYMYMFTMYDNISWSDNTDWMYTKGTDLMFRTWAKDLLVKWNAADPVSEKERVRNDGIQKHQRNRNPFIDLPDLADHIWGAKSNEPFYVDGHVTPDPGPEPGPDPQPEPELEYNWFAETNSEIEADWTIDNVNLSSTALSYIWGWRDYNGKGYLNASAYVQGTPYASEAYIYSPEISLENCKNIILTFDHAAKFQTTCRQLCHPVIREAGSSDWTSLEIPTWPTAGGWDFVNAGAIDLSDWAGHTVQVGFRYGSTDQGADTWEIRNVKLTAQKTTAIELPVEDDGDDSFLVEVWGNNILAPEGARIFDLNGREVSGLGLQRGIYIVAKPTFRKSVKVMVK